MKELIVINIMWTFVILLLCVTGISAGILVETHTNSLSLDNGENNGREFERIRRFACPVGFFRLKRNCYYLSAGVAQWRDAYFHCKDRNSTLAELDKNGKDRILRKYLMGEQFTRLERWIGGMYNWHQMAWQWGVKGERVIFQNFAGSLDKNPMQYAWHCIVLDPSVKYKWTPRSCLEKKHYICEVPAGRIGRRRKKTINQELVPQNQRLRPRKHGKKRRRGKNDLRAHRRGKAEVTWNKDWVESHDNQEWAHGVKLGSRPLSQKKITPEMRQTNRTRHRNNRNRGRDRIPQITQLAPQGHDHAFLGDGPVGGQPKALSDDKTFSHYHGKINDLSLEEILIKN